jgi:alternate signal-mediated exported protein
MHSATKAVIAGVAGLALLSGGAGSLAYWTDTKSGSPVTIASGDLSLGSIADGTGWSLQQNEANVPVKQIAGVAYTNQLVVPGDVLSKTISVPVTLTGANNKATFSVTSATLPANALASSLVVSIVSVNGVAGSTATLTPAAVTTAGGLIPVIVSIAVPWGTSADNTNKALSTAFTASYTLTQVSAT